MLRQLRRRLLGGEQSAETIRQDAAAAIDLLLGAQAPLLAMLDPASAVHLVGHPALVTLWTALLDVEADASEASGDAVAAARQRARTTALRNAARQLWGETGDALDAESPTERPEA